MAKRISIFDDEPKFEGNPFVNDIVGTFHGGYHDGKKPVSLDKWRFTSDDPNVAERIAELLGGETQEIGEGDRVKTEVFTDATDLEILLDLGSESISTEFILWANGKVIMRGDGVTLDDGTPDPGAELELSIRKERAKNNLVPAPQTEVLFRLADDPDLGIFRFVQSKSWNFERDLTRTGFFDKLEDAGSDGTTVKAALVRQPESFVAKTGDMAGKTVSFTAAKLKFKGYV